MIIRGALYSAVAWFSIACQAATTVNQPIQLDSATISKYHGVCDDEKCYLGDIIAYKEKGIHPFGAIGGITWTSGKFVYEFSGQSLGDRDTFRLACAEWAKNTALKCIERTSESVFTKIVTHNGEGCGGHPYVSCSAVGMVARPGRPQQIEIYSGHWSWAFHVIVHEIGHALGLIHEQSRSDRDNYVIINWGNIPPSATFNFFKNNYSINKTDYDYLSIMHYNNCTFSTNSRCRIGDRSTESYWTISPAACSLDQVGGNNVTALDIDGITRTYGGKVASLYKQSRKSTCGELKYSKSQVAEACGSNCSYASPVSWTRFHTRYDKGCGWLPIFDSDGYCRGRRQEFESEWYDKDWPVKECWGGTRVERWVRCGCSAQSLAAACSDYDAGIDVNELKKLSENGSPLEREAAYFIEGVEKIRNTGAFDSDSEKIIASLYLAAFIQTESSDNSKSQEGISTFSKAARGVLCELQLLSAIRGKMGEAKPFIRMPELTAVVKKWELADI